MFGALKLFHMIPRRWVPVITHLSKSIECTPPSVSLGRPWILGDGDLSVQVRQPDQRTFCWGMLVVGEAVCAGGGRRHMGESLYFPFSFVVNLK